VFFSHGGEHFGFARTASGAVGLLCAQMCNKIIPLYDINLLGYYLLLAYNILNYSYTRCFMSHKKGRNGLRMFDNWMLRRLFGSNRGKLKGTGQKLHIESFVISVTSILTVI
jgi:hypothetical protein